ncbi:MAG: GIY-YIG nuclease family protein [Thermincola sp.]|jgi:putative endonuclease|nr:GIY-YIG nuclease family protein [Thermincola sp.]MDT3702071.1 GIY-YIG nuclease family protein [Thermincola sp.]
MNKRYFTYIIRCKNGILYTGYTNDLVKRIAQHNENKGAKFTRGRGPVALVYFEEFPTRGEAMAREIKIKRLSRPEKEKLISGDESE